MLGAGRGSAKGERYTGESLVFGFELKLIVKNRIFGIRLSGGWIIDLKGNVSGEYASY